MIITVIIHRVGKVTKDGIYVFFSENLQLNSHGITVIMSMNIRGVALYSSADYSTENVIYYLIR